MQVIINGKGGKPRHYHTDQEPIIAPMRAEWSDDARCLDDLVETTKSDILSLGYSGVSNGCGGETDTEELFCGPELSLGLLPGFHGEPQYLPSAHLSVTGYRKISLPLSDGGYHGVHTIQGQSDEYLFQGARMHMFDQLRLWRTAENIFAPLHPTRPRDFYADMKSETTFFYRLEIFDLGIMIFGKVDGIPERAERFMYELVKTTLPLFEAFHSLEAYYQHVDKDGKRLWIDEGKQSKAYYRHAENLARDIASAVRRIARKYDMPAQNTHSISSMFRLAPAEMLLRTVFSPLHLVSAMKHRSAGFFRYQIRKIRKFFG